MARRSRTATDRLSEAAEKELKRELAAAKKALKALHKTFAERLEETCAALRPDEVSGLVLRILKAELRKELDRYVTAHRQRVVAAVENWWDKYRVTVRDIEKERDAAKDQLAAYLDELGYV